MSAFFARVQCLLAEVAVAQAGAISQAADWVAESLRGGGVWHVFGTGHSHLVGEELYYRAGGLAAVNAILFPALMQHEGPATSTQLERVPGLATVVLGKEDLRAGEVFLVVSNSGKNAVPVEAAIYAKARGLRTVALTSLAQSRAASLGAGQSQKLYEVCDLVIDNGGSAGDASLAVPGSEALTGPTSSVVNLSIVQQIVYEVCLRYAAVGEAPPLFKSANLPGGDAWNAALIARYRERARLW